MAKRTGRNHWQRAARKKARSTQKLRATRRSREIALQREEEERERNRPKSLSDLMQRFDGLKRLEIPKLETPKLSFEPTEQPHSSKKPTPSLLASQNEKQS